MSVTVATDWHYVFSLHTAQVIYSQSLRVRNGKVSTTDGPFAETKEQFGGYYLIEAINLNEAIQIAARIPGARMGCVEVRPVAEDAQTLALGLNATSATIEKK